MKSLTELFVSEFDVMVRDSKVLPQNIGVDLFSLAVPDSFKLSKFDSTLEQVKILGIVEEFYNKLNSTTAYLLSRPRLTRKKYNFNGDYVLDADGKNFIEEVTVPEDCLAVLSKVKISVPNKNKTSTGFFEYVDVYLNEEFNKKSVFYIYIIPRSVCYKINLVSLCASFERPRRIYGGCTVHLIQGHKVYVYIAPFKVSSVRRNYRIFTVKSSLDLLNEYKELLTYWGNNGIIYTIDLLWLDEIVNGRQNVAYSVLDKTIDEYVQFNVEQSMAVFTSTLDELDIM